MLDNTQTKYNYPTVDMGRFTNRWYEAKEAELKVKEQEMLDKQQESIDSDTSDDYSIPSLADIWRQTNVQGHSVNLNKKQEELRQSEGTWLPQINTAKEYLQLKQRNLEIDSILESNNITQDQINQLQLEKQNNLYTMQQIEPQVKNFARTNPYLQDVFYRTDPGILLEGPFKNVKSWINFHTYDWLTSDNMTDYNPINNLKHQLSTEGIDMYGTITHKLSKEQLDYMWDSVNNPNNIKNQLDKLNEQELIAKEQYDSKIQDLIDKIDTIKKGNWLFDPSKIDPNFTKKFNENEIKLSDPKSWLYAIPHIGSSYSEYGVMLAQMSASTLLSHGAKIATTATTGGVVPLLWAATEAGTNYMLSSYARTSETSAELFSHYQERVLNLLEQNKIDLNQILSKQMQQLKDLGYDTDSMNQYELFQATIAQGLLSDNEAYNKILKEAQKGLEVVKQTNNALSIPDYLERAVWDFGGPYLAKMYGSRKILGKMAAGNQNANVNTFVRNKLLNDEANSVLNNRLVKAVNKIAKNPMTKVSTARTLDKVTSIGKKLGFTYFSERTEEGIQNLVATRYKQGQYDNAENYTLLDGAANASQLGFEANLAYYGLHPDNTLNTDKDLINEMKIGGFTSLFQTGVYSVPDVYSTTRQVLTDQKLKGLLADHYNDATTDSKIDQIIKAVKKGKDSNFSRVRNSLQSLKQFKPDDVTDEMIDSDIELTNQISTFSSAKPLNKIAKELGLKFGDDSYTRIIQNAINIHNRLKDAVKSSENSTNILSQLEQKIINNLNNSAFEEFLKSSFNQYLEDNETKNQSLKEEDRTKPLEYEVFKNRMINVILRMNVYNTLNKLSKELNNRGNDLSKLKEDTGLDVNLRGIKNINKFINKMLETSKKDIDNMLKGNDFQTYFDSLPELPLLQEFENSVTAKFVNDGVRDYLMQHLNAYVSGEYYGDILDFMPTWDKLTDQQRKDIINNYREEDQNSNRPLRSEKEIEQQYNQDIRTRIERQDEIADGRDTARKRALLVIQNDLTNKELKNQQANSENIEDKGTITEQPVIDEENKQQQQIEESTSETEQNKQEEPATTVSSNDEGSTQIQIEAQEAQNKQNQVRDTEAEKLLSKLDEMDNEKSDDSKQQLIDEIEAGQYENPVSSDNESIAVREEVSNNTIQPENENHISEEFAEEVTKDKSEDAVEEQLNKQDENNAEEVKKESQQPQTIEEEQEDKSKQSDNNVSEPPVSKNTVYDVPSETDNPDLNGLNAQSVFIDPSTGNTMYDPTGQDDINNAITVDDSILFEQNSFDVLDMDQYIGPSSKQNKTANTDTSSPIETSSKNKRLHIANTFFYLPTESNIMPIQTYGKPVTFNTKDGKTAKRASGSELADNLVKPGWIESIDDAYFCVTSSINDMTNTDAVDLLAIHLIIEKDGVVYNTSLRAINDKLISEMRRAEMSDQDIQEQINKLRTLRNNIIQAYAPNYFKDKVLPTTASKHVKPINLKISNGSLDNTVDSAGIVTFRNLTEIPGFEVPSNPSELTDKLLDAENGIEIGYGTGPLSENYEPFSLVDMRTGELTSVQCKGYAGKLFLIPKVYNTPSKKTTVPVMLAEQKHTIDSVNSPMDIQLAKDSKGNRLSDKEGKAVPFSTAEIIYEIMTNGLINAEIDDFLLKLLANTGSRTFAFGLTDQEQYKFNFLVRKQLGIYKDSNGDDILVIGVKDSITQPQYAYSQAQPEIYKTRTYKVKNITDSQKRNIVYNISKNIHWNTNKDLLYSNFPKEFVEAIITIANNRMKTDKSFNQDTVINLLNNEQLGFTLTDLGYTIQNGNIVKTEGTEPIVLSWLIRTGKIRTDVSPNMFFAPFVYADGAVIDQNQKPKQAKVSKEVNVVSNKKENANPQKPKTDTEVKAQENKTTPKKVTKAISVRDENGNISQEILDKYDVTIPEGQKLPVGWDWGILPDKKTGKMKCISVPKNKIDGVYSVVRGQGSMNEEQTVEWIQEVLGLDKDNIRLTNNIIKTMSGKEAYGVLRVATDSINGVLHPTITLSTLSGQGIEYHEAFHYVSLLLLNKYNRERVYQDYVDKHPEAKDLTKDEVEELLAEEFRNYMLSYNKYSNKKGLTYRIIRFFQDLYDYVKAFFNKKDITNTLFRQISKGKFKNLKPSEEAMQEFQKKYQEGVFYYIPGLTDEDLNNMPNIPDDTTFYQIVDSLMSTSLAIFNIRKIEDVHNLNLDQLFNNMEMQLDNGLIEEENEGVVNDVINNKDIFKRFIKRKLNNLAIKINDKDETKDEKMLKRDVGYNPDNTWDINQGEISKKDNIAFRAKLFFYSLPRYEYKFIEDENGNITRVIEPSLDNIFGFPNTIPFDEVWVRIMEHLWDIDTYDDIITECKRLSEADPIFYSMLQMLTSKENPITDNEKRQLEVTIKSAKLQLTTISVEHPRPKIDRNASDENIQDAIEQSLKQYIWKVRDSDNLRLIKRLPAIWSNSFYTSELIETNEDGEKSLNHKAVQYITKLRNSININIKKATRKDIKTDEQTKITLQIKSDFISLCNTLKIPFDMKSLDYMLNNIRDSHKTVNSQLNRFITFWNANDSNTFNKAIIGNIVSMDKNNTIYIKNRKGETVRSADKIFTYYDQTAQINQMAVAYGKMHPSPQEFSVTGADGSLIYPISENNYFTDQIRNLNKDLNGKRQQILNTPYSSRSFIANAKDTKFKLHSFLMLDMNDGGRDYFGITPIEDYICKLTLTFNNHMILPTMADKKTWYSISGLTLVKDFLSSKVKDNSTAASLLSGESNVDDSYIIGERRFSNDTLNKFSAMLLDEFDAVYDYFKHKSYIEKHPTERVDNYHGKIKNGKMDDSGNGGRFRYFSSLVIGGEIVNVNQELSKYEKNGTTEDVIKYLKKLKVLLLNTETVNDSKKLNGTEPIYDAVNKFLLDAVEEEMKWLLKNNIITKTKSGYYHNNLIPDNIFEAYSKMANKFYKSNETQLKETDIIYSIIGSHVANNIISIVEVEKCFTGDPAYYKWKKKEIKKEGQPSYDIITGRDVDKIKRLSAVLSTGTNLAMSGSDTNINVLQLSDNNVYSDYKDTLYNMFRNQALRDMLSLEHPDWTDDQLIEYLDTKDKEDKYFETLSAEKQEFVNSQATNGVNPYSYEEKNGNKQGNINQSDAAVYIRPDLYRRIRIALGDWDDDVQAAYEIMEGEDETWMEDPKLYQKTISAVFQPLKMVYFGDHRNDKLNLNIPVFDKMAMFPMFKALAKADNRLLYNRMNSLNEKGEYDSKLGTIDMLTFESAVKVGGRKKFNTYLDAENTKFNITELFKPSYLNTRKEGDLPVFSQNMNNLRLQLNTSPHEHIERSFGTQATKICLGNLIDDRTYGTNKGINKKGYTIKKEVMNAINALTKKGAEEVIHRFFNKQEEINYKELSKYLIDQAMDNNMPQEFIEGLKLNSDGEFIVPLEASSNRNWIASRLISYVNKTVIDINTAGGAAIQMSSFGFKSTTKLKQKNIGRALNDGKKLKFLREDGSMEVMLSTNFFRHIVPKEFQGSYGQMRKWLLDHNLIGENAKPIGVGYRIPTQGLSSTFSFVVTDVLPDRHGDTIVVPDEFTGMTGSDFDVDKLYIAMLNTDSEGNVIQYKTDKNGKELDVMRQSKEALQNRIIQSYQLTISDNKNIAETRASIDTLTKSLQNDVLPKVTKTSKVEAKPAYELLPSFQCDKKTEFTSGKAGIAPFALNSTNHCLTQFVHLCFKYSNNNRYGLNQLDEIKGRDGQRILDWLSAMINAHVDVAKDPYVIQLNVNQTTYNITNLLLRGGMGKTTFYYLAQPILRRFANKMLENKGVYGVKQQYENAIISELYAEYGKALRQKIQESNDEKWIGKYNSIADEIGLDYIGDPSKNMSEAFKGEDLFNDDTLIYALENPDSIESLYIQLLSMRAYSQLSADAKILSDLVQRSQIDTKKYGNNIALQMNFSNSFEVFNKENADRFYIRDMEMKNGDTALDYYFNKTFLGTKKYEGLRLPKKILKHQLFSATYSFEKLFTSAMSIFRGRKEYENNDGSTTVAYSHTSDKVLVNTFQSYITDVIKARITRDIPELYADEQEINEMFYGSNTLCKRLTGIKEYILENASEFPTLVESNGLYIKNAMLNYLYELPGDGEVQTIDRIIPIDSSINLTNELEDALTSAFAELLNSPDHFVREFARDLVKYAWLTSYDERGSQSLFQFVPNSYKQQIGYIDAVRQQLDEFKEINNEYSYASIVEEQDDPGATYFPSFNIIIARNMWQDDTIVEPITLTLQEASNKRVTEKSLYKVTKQIKGKTILIHDLFSTTQKHKEYVKVNYGKGASKTTEIYRLVGTTKYVNSEGEPISSGTRYIYQRIPKLGIYDNNFRLMELQKNSLEPSAFAINDFEQASMLTAEEIENYALNGMPLKKNSEFTKTFIRTNQNSIKARIKSQSESVPKGTYGQTVEEMTATINNEVEAFNNINQQLNDEVNDFVNLEFQDTGITVAGDEIQNQLDIVQSMGETFDLLSKDNYVDMGQLMSDNTQSVDMEELVNLGKNRRKHCKNQKK